MVSVLTPSYVQRAHIRDPCSPYHFHPVLSFSLRVHSIAVLHALPVVSYLCSPQEWYTVLTFCIGALCSRLKCCSVPHCSANPVQRAKWSSARQVEIKKIMAWPARRSPHLTTSHTRCPHLPPSPPPHIDMLLHVPHYRVPEPYQSSSSPKPSCKYARTQTSKSQIPFTYR